MREGDWNREEHGGVILRFGDVFQYVSASAFGMRRNPV